MRWPGRVQVSDEVRAAAGLARGERVLASATTTDDATVLATRERLVLVGADGLRWQRSWSQVDAAVWDVETEVLRVVWLGGPVTELALVPGTRPGLAETVRERVESSVVTSRRVAVRGHGGVRLVVRRAGPGLLLQVVPDDGTRLDDPAVADAVEQARAELADQVGASLTAGPET